MALKKCAVGVHKQCVLLQAGSMRLAVTTNVGPRVIGCFIGKKSTFNHFAVLPPTPMENVSNGFTLYGGHRLWHSPEELPRTYEPDNAPVKVEEKKYRVLFSSAPCPETGISKTIAVEPLTNGLFSLSHWITNHGLWTVKLAPWTLSQMAPGGTCVLPLGNIPDGNPFAPDRTVNFWPYTDLKDPRLTMGNRFITVRHDPKAESPLKVGVRNRCQWVAYLNHGQALVKYFQFFREQPYPDNGCSTECYTCKDFTEMELLGPLVEIAPGKTVEFVEFWQGIDGLPELTTEDEIAAALYPNLIIDPESVCDEDDEGECGDEDDDCECGCECGCEDDDCECGCEHEAPAKKSSSKKASTSKRKGATASKKSKK